LRCIELNADGTKQEVIRSGQEIEGGATLPADGLTVIGGALSVSALAKAQTVKSGHFLQWPQL
jgi:hypothetical protein